jgi:hypothetical protein
VTCAEYFLQEPMKRIRLSEEQTIAVLHEAGAKAADLARKHGISEAPLYNWKAKYGGLDELEALWDQLNLHASAVAWFRQKDDQPQCLESIEPIGHAGARRLRQLARWQSIGIARSAKSGEHIKKHAAR